MKNLQKNKGSVIHYLILIAVALMFVLTSLPNASALELNPFADVKHYEPALKEDMSNFIKDDFNPKYGVIQISSTFFWVEGDKIAEYSLTSNTDYCLIDCEADGRATLYQDGSLFDGANFKDKLGNLLDINAKYFIYVTTPYEVNIPSEYKEVCNETTGTENLFCVNYIVSWKKETRYKTEWKEYNGEDLKAGDYLWKVEGKKMPAQSVDVIPVKSGKEFSEWVWWNINSLRKQKIDFTVESGNYSYFKVAYDADMEPNFRDLKFTNSLETYELNYTIENYSASSWAAIRLNNHNDNTVYMYYKNSSSFDVNTNSSNASATYYGPSAYYYLNELTGTTSITAINSTTRDGVVNASVVMGFGGKVNTSYIFPSRYSQANATTHPNMLAMDNTYNFWVYANNFSNNNRLISCVGGSTSGYNDIFWQNTTMGNQTCFRIWDGAQQQVCSGNLSLNKWYMLTGVTSGNQILIYANGTFVANRTIGAKSANIGNNELVFGQFTTDTSANVSIDEYGTWDRALTAAEIGALYTSAIPTATFGPEQSGSLGVTLNSPIDFYNSTNSIINFNCSAVSYIAGRGVVNITLIINGIDVYTLSNTTNNVNLSINTTNSLPSAKGNWTCRASDNVDAAGIAVVRNFTIDFIHPVINILTPADILYLPPYSSSFDLNYTATDENIKNCSYSFNGAANISFNCTVNFTGINFTKLGQNTITLYANDTFGNYNSSAKTFYVNPTMSRCNATYSQEHTLLNFSFRDETTNTNMNASIDSSTFVYWYDNQNVNQTYLYSNATENWNYTFCVYPNWTANLSMTYNIKYSSDTYSAVSYPVRTYEIAITTYANSTINWIILYLIDTNNAIFTTFQTMTSGGVIIPGVLLQIEREIGGIWTLVTQSTTDDAGTASFWLNPNFEHKITATKTGYASVTKYLNPTASTYTIIMGSTGATGIEYSYYRQGLTYSMYPKAGLLQSGKYNFSFVVVYQNTNSLTLENCSLELMNSTRDVTNITYHLKNSTYCRPVFSAFDFTESRFGRYSVKINGTWLVLEGDAHWMLYSPNNTNTGLLTFINQSTFLCQEWAANGTCVRSDWGDNPETNDFSRLVFFFLIMAVVISAINFYSSYDTLYPGASIYLIWAAIVLGSFANGAAGPGFFYMDVVNLNTTVVGVSPTLSTTMIMNNWIVAIFTSMIVFSMTMMNIRRNEGG